jgi:hypothetical protein
LKLSVKMRIKRVRPFLEGHPRRIYFVALLHTGIVADSRTLVLQSSQSCRMFVGRCSHHEGLYYGLYLCHGRCWLSWVIEALKACKLAKQDSRLFFALYPLVL